MRGRRVAIIGGAGFIGHHLALALAQHGAHVEIIDSLQINNLLWFASQPDMHNRELCLRILNERFDLLRAANVLIHPQDARDYHVLSRILDAIKPHVIVHLAAVVARRPIEQGSVQHVRSQLADARECARLRADRR
jgi:nucleoside-diphosphate-sugar epimerase